mgnify:CR=1 FL=1
MGSDRGTSGDPAMAGAPLAVDTVDYHTGGEPFRIIVGGVPAPEGATILERRRFALEHLDHVRRFLVHEPRGHADMYGCHVVPPNDAGADLGVVFFHNEGYSTACGHGTIALVTWALESGVVAMTGPETAVIVDVPSGRLACVARCDLAARRVTSVRFTNVPSFVLAAGVTLPTSRGPISLDVAYGGAFYGSADVRRLGLAVETGSRTHHSAILARSMRLPAVAGLEGATALVRPGARVLVDGYSGEVIIDPSDQEIDAGAEASAENLVAALKNAFEDDSAQAVVLRINSPGGSPVQAGIINDEVRRLKAKHNKPVYVVVEETCASAAYYIACAASSAVAARRIGEARRRRVARGRRLAQQRGDRDEGSPDPGRGAVESDADDAGLRSRRRPPGPGRLRCDARVAAPPAPARARLRRRAPQRH